MKNWFSKWMTPRHIRSLLGELGSNSREVANVLRELGIHSDRKNGDCPIGVFLQRQGYPVMVGTTSLYIKEDRDDWRFVRLPEACAQFVRDYDEGAYPDLRG